MPIHLTHEYLTRSNNNRYKGTEIFIDNLLLHGVARNIGLKLLPDNPGVRSFGFSINPVADSTCSPFIAFEFQPKNLVLPHGLELFRFVDDILPIES
jgi:hypothetical protein